MSVSSSNTYPKQLQQLRDSEKQEDRWWDSSCSWNTAERTLCWAGNSRVPSVPYSDFLSSIIGLSIHNLGFLLKEKVLSSTNSFSRLISTWTVSTWTLVLAYGSRRHRSKTRRQRWERIDFLETYIISASFWSRDVKVSTPRQWCPGIICLRATR